MDNRTDMEESTNLVTAEMTELGCHSKSISPIPGTTSNKNVRKRKRDQAVKYIFGQELKNHAESTTMHGCSNLTSGDIVKKILWLGIIFGTIGGASYYIKYRLSDYMKYNIAVSFQKKYINETARSLKIPKITICNYRTGRRI